LLASWLSPTLLVFRLGSKGRETKYIRCYGSHVKEKIEYIMALFEWKPEYSVQFEIIDSQHKRLFEIANELHVALKGGKGKDQLSALLSNLIAYTKNHFATEENLMRIHSYPDYACHKKLHDELTRQVMQFQKEFDAGNSTTSASDVMQFLSDWLRHHIMETDVRIGAFLKTKTGSQAERAINLPKGLVKA
jgi:hemerythrin